MKLITRILSLAFISALAISFSNCGGDGGGSTPKEKVQLGKLSKTWNIVSAELDSDDRTLDFDGFTLTISGTFNSSSPEGPYSYSVGGDRPTPSPWPTNGTWEFGPDPNTQLIRIDDEIAMSYSINSNDQLTLTFTCSDCDYAGSGRTAEVQGVWIFVLD